MGLISEMCHEIHAQCILMMVALLLTLDGWTVGGGRVVFLLPDKWSLISCVHKTYCAQVVPLHTENKR